jgi:hypothetical protein
MDLYRQSVGLLGRVISPIVRPLPTQVITHTEETRIDIYVSSVIRNHGPTVREAEDVSCLRPRDHCGRK